ncbi:glutathione synthase [Vulgatibacter incomptus]|uniref:Glutathione synthetase n=1 Tax=Vulgatibacter incomptus TaxID=1391653 RepID=A0A0K1P9J9_9BACT|nr:glutathione synthase [Vulgatibacter incomptus]AKU90200.1 Glutathione synthetase [Vulgatibacter incomptus]
MELLFLMDPLERVAPDKDTTYALMRAFQARGHSLWFAESRDLSLVGGSPFVVARQVEVRPAPAIFAWLSEPVLREVSAFPVVWLRTDPPFDEAYLEATWILDRVDRSRCLVVNDPTGVRGANEKLYALCFPELCPPTLVSSNRRLVRRFVEEHGEAVLKPPNGHAGSGILFAQAGMRGLDALIEVATAGGSRTEAQAYLPEAKEGDKRILLLDGEPLGAILRVHGPGEERNNLHLGGTAERTALDEADWRIVRTVAPKLRADGLVFVGLDVIGGKLTEVNVTSPTGIQEIEALDGPGACARVVEWTERRAQR